MESSSDRVSHEKGHSDMNEISRTMTLALSPEQYERLFFQPSASKGDLSKRLGNPTVLGLLGFLIPLSAAMFSLLKFQGSDPTSLAAISGSFYYIGGIIMNVASIMEFILGNTFPMTVFMVYGCHWLYLGYTNDPLHGIVESYGAEGALSQAYNAGQGNYNVVMVLVTFIFLIGSLRTNVPFVLLFSCLIFLFSFLAAAYYSLGFNPTVAGLDHAFYYFKIGAGFGFVAMLDGWYLAIITVCASTGVPCPLPVFDLSSKVFAGNAANKDEHARSSAAHGH